MSANKKGAMRPFVASSVFAALMLVFASQTFAQHERQVAQAAQPAKQGRVPCPAATDLPAVPEIKSDPTTHRLKGTVKAIDGLRTVWNSATSPGTPPSQTQCGSVYMRYFTGHTGLNIEGPDDPGFATGDPLPGPTLRARVGDWIEIAFLNQINAKHFGKSLDRGDNEPAAGGAHAHGTAPTPNPSAGCDVTTRFTMRGGKRQTTRSNGDVFPNCIHGSSTTNLHFHGTHTTPNTTGDNVLLFVRPALRKNNLLLQPYTHNVNAAMAAFFTQCESHGYPSTWADMVRMVPSWKTAQYAAINYYDNNTSYGASPPPLPVPARLWPVNQHEIDQGGWPQYSIGGSPVCFPLPAYDPRKNDPPRVRTMGQAPGTHWYHAHKHGSTALNVANGMIGALIIEGQYDDQMRAFYRSQPGWDFKERVLVVQQLTGVLNKTAPTGTGPASLPIPVLSINGRRTPVITMRPNQVQLFRFVNGAERDGIVFQNFAPEPSGSASCSKPATTPCVHWNQTAQDGVQLIAANYDPDNTAGSGYKGNAQDKPFYLAPANRADLLMQAPSTPGRYDLSVVGGVCREVDSPTCGLNTPQILLTVSVEAPAVSSPMPFIPIQSFPTFPKFLADIKPSDVVYHRDLVFQDIGPGKLSINGQQFRDGHINQTMVLNTVEEWTVSNMDNDKEHPFHIHINPFQIFEVFSPQSADTQPGGKCPVDPTDPTTWKPYGKCANTKKSNFVWWDTFAIPASQQDTVPQACSALTNVPAANKTVATPTSCVVTIPGYFKMRSQFVDFPGQFVLHCHILTHEDRGMMELIQVIPDTTIYTHH